MKMDTVCAPSKPALEYKLLLNILAIYKDIGRSKFAKKMCRLMFKKIKL